MSEADFFSAQAKGAAAESVRSVEAVTAAEVVVAVRKSSGHYGILAYHFGFGLAACAVLYLLLSPEPYGGAAFALDALLAFALGSLLAANLDTLRRMLARSRRLDENVSRAAKATFFELGISRTSGRNGILVYVSLFERRCVVLTDIGIESAALEPGWSEIAAVLNQALARRNVLEFCAALKSMGPILARAYPRSADDVNELVDEVQ